MKNIYKLFIITLFALSTIAFSQIEIVDIWNGNTPNLVEGAENIQEVIDQNSSGTFISKVTKPTIEVYLPPEDIATGTGVVICPGGGYSLLAFDYEGQDVAKWFNSIGVAGFVLKYRLPEPSIVQVRHIAPLQDAQRALRYVRHRAEEWKINPDQIGILGFSAGGHLAGTATVHCDTLFTYVDSVDTQSAIPNFGILVYPVTTMGPGTHSGSKSNLLGSSPSPEMVDYFSVEKQITAETPPVFITVSSNDGTVEFEPNSKTLFDSLQANSIPSELWVYEETLASSHGYGLGIDARETIEWPWRLALWMQANGWSTIVPTRPRYTFLNIDRTNFGSSSNEDQFQVQIECDSTWQVLSETVEWITLDKQQGEKIDSLSFSITANSGDKPRTAEIIIGHELRQDTLQVLQAAANRFGQFLIGGSKPNTGEQQLLNAALQAGIVLSWKTDNSLDKTGTETETVDFVLISDSNSRSMVDDLYSETPLPVMVMETGVLDKMGMTGTRQFGQERDVQQLIIQNDQHPLAAGFSGAHDVFMMPARMNWGTPGEAAVTVATVGEDETRACIFAYHSGDPLADGTTAAGKRLGFFISSNNAEILTGQGITLWQAALEWLLDETSEVQSKNANGNPEQFQLKQNYPNPFNPSTTISYQLAGKTHVVVEIFDIRGRQVEKLVDSVQQAGEYQFSFNAEHLPSGTYFYQLKTKQYSQIRKMLLLR